MFLAPTDPCDISLCSHHLHFCKVVDGMAKCVCRQVCPLILLPVCGSDGQTYPNNCTLEVEACVTGKDLTVASMGECGKLYIKHEGECFITFPDTEKRVENTTCSGVFLTNFEVFGNVMKHSHECLI